MLNNSGFPPKITTHDWKARFGTNFPDLLEDDKETLIQMCIDDVYTIFRGISELWSNLERPVYENKVKLCYYLLTAWYIADLYPDSTVGVMTTGGIPIASKKIGNVDIKFKTATTKAGSKNNANLLESLKSNAFGAKAFLMIKDSGRLNTFIRI